MLPLAVLRLNNWSNFFYDSYFARICVSICLDVVKLRYEKPRGLVRINVLAQGSGHVKAPGRWYRFFEKKVKIAKTYNSFPAYGSIYGGPDVTRYRAIRSAPYPQHIDVGSPDRNLIVNPNDKYPF